MSENAIGGGWCCGGFTLEKRLSRRLFWLLFRRVLIRRPVNRAARLWKTDAPVSRSNLGRVLKSLPDGDMAPKRIGMFV